MTLHFFIAGAAFVGMFIVFLVLSRTLGSIINQLAKLEYVVSKDVEFRKETLEIQRLLQDDVERRQRSVDRTDDEEKGAAGPAAAPVAPPPGRGGKGPEARGGKKPA